MTSTIKKKKLKNYQIFKLLTSYNYDKYENQNF